MTRRLAAILMADVVGYSQLMSGDEAGTLAALQTHQTEVFNPLIDTHGGRIVKLMGDGSLVEFSSVVDAARAALAIQEANILEESIIRLRIGVTLGDIIVDDGDIYGEGVNIAARLESMAATNGICISSIAHESIGNRIDADFEDAGEHTVKGMKQPIRVFRWPATGAFKQQEDKPSIAVLPFENMSSDPEDAYFSHGIADDIATDLSRISGLVVMARSATSSYKDQSVSSARVARDLGVRYVLEGSVRRGGTKLRVNARLMDADKSTQIWADRFDGELQDIFDLQDSISESIVATLSITLTRAEQERAFRKDAKNLYAYDYVLQANAVHSRFTKKDNAEAMELYRRAIELDPAYAPAHAGLAWALTHDSNQDWSSNPKEALDLALVHAREAVRLDSGLAKARMVLGDVYCWMKQHNLSVSEGRKAVELDPTNADAHFALSHYLITAGKSDEAIGEAKLALRYNPVHARCDYYQNLGKALYLTNQYEAACEPLEEGLGRCPDSDGLHQWLAANYAQLGRIEDARLHAQKYLTLRSGVTLKRLAETLPYKSEHDLEHMFDGLRKAGVPD